MGAGKKGHKKPLWPPLWVAEVRHSRFGDSDEASSVRPAKPCLSETSSPHLVPYRIGIEHINVSIPRRGCTTLLDPRRLDPTDRRSRRLPYLASIMHHPHLFRRAGGWITTIPLVPARTCVSKHILSVPAAARSYHAASVLPSLISPSSPEFRARAEAMDQLVADLEAKLAAARAGGGPKAAERMRGKGKRLPRERCGAVCLASPRPPSSLC
jgi:hypothetical protein